MKEKIDPIIYKTVRSMSSANEKIDCLIYTSNPKRLKKYFESNQSSLSVEKIQCLEFINAVAINVPLSNLLKISSLKLVEYVTGNADVLALMDISKKVLRIDEVHQAGLTGEGVTICYIDTGLSSHIDFAGENNRVLKFVNFTGDRQEQHDDNGHGTFVCGVGSGNGKASEGRYCGIAPKSNIVALKALSSEGESGAITILTAMQWVFDHHAEYGIKVVCMSFGSDPMAVGDPIAKGAEMLVGKGITVVAAAGNSGPDYQTVKSPGVSQKIITVGGIDDKRNPDGSFRANKFKIANFSSRGPAFRKIKPDVVAPAVDIISCSIDEQLYCKMSGTSVATPMIAGMCALLIQKYPQANPHQIKQKLLSSCKSITFNRNAEGFGLVDGVKFILF